jgi:hypothetical protein
MLNFFRAGGFNMWILAGLGIVLVWTAIRFARNADAQRLSLIRALTWTIVFAAVTGFFSSIGVAARSAVRMREEAPLEELVLIGFAESTTNLTLGFGILAISWIIVCVGLRRMPGDRS